jgi:hypothetical protein
VHRYRLQIIVKTKEKLRNIDGGCEENYLKMRVFSTMLKDVIYKMLKNIYMF